MLLEPGIYIDARKKGSFTRFVNHSCEPNCKTEKWTVAGVTRIAVVALRDLSPLEELTFDYQWKAFGSRQIKYVVSFWSTRKGKTSLLYDDLYVYCRVFRCHCGAPTCKGVIGTETEGANVVDSMPDGFFREPEGHETGDALAALHHDPAVKAGLATAELAPTP